MFSLVFQDEGILKAMIRQLFQLNLQDNHKRYIFSTYLAIQLIEYSIDHPIQTNALLD